MPWTKIDTNENQFQIDNQSGKRIKTYIEAIHEAFDIALGIDHNVYMMGQGINDKLGLFGGTTDLYKKYGEDRVFETPLSEAGLMGIAVGTAISGMRPIYCHNRPDFLMLTMDQIVNHAGKMNFMSGGQCKVPMVVWATTGMGWGSAAQHSQALHGMFMHIPGIKIIMPTTPYDAKGLMLSAIADNNPVMFFEHRKLFSQMGYVPEEAYKIPIGKGVVRREGKDVTIVAISLMMVEALKAAQELEKHGISAEVIDLRTIKPFDIDIIIESIKKTGRLVIADTGGVIGGIGAEIAASVVEKGFGYLNAPIKRIGCEDTPTPASYALEKAFYKTEKDIINTVVKWSELW